MNGEAIGLRGHLIDAPAFGTLRSEVDGALIIADGKIVARGSCDHVSRTFQAPVSWRDYRGDAIIPGLIDCHTHLPQYPAVACGESALLPWLRDRIFPLERGFDAARAREEAPHFFAELARNGTTTAAIFTAIYEESCDATFAAAQTSGLRAIVGKMMMDVGSYGHLAPTEAFPVSLEESGRLCQKWHGADAGRLDYAFSPRFAVSCSADLMRAAANLASNFDAYRQTHLAENRDEISQVRRLFPQWRDYTNVYHECGLLTPKTILGHCLHLDEREIAIIAASGAAVAHCPTSNLFLGSGLFQIERFLDAGIPIGLGSDVAAGPELNMWRVMRGAIETQKARLNYERTARAITPADAFYLATNGGAQALAKANIIGTLEPGKEADVTVIDFHRARPYPQNETGQLSPEDVIALCIYRGGPEMTAATYVRGRCVYSRKDA